MKKSTILKISALTLCAVLFGAIWTTEARWSTMVSVKNNKLRTGGLTLSVTPGDNWLSLDGLVPGNSVERQIKIQNSGSIPARIILNAKKAAGYSNVYAALLCELRRLDQSVIWQGLLSDLVNVVIVDRLEAATGLDAIISVTLSEDASPEISNSYADITFEVISEQL